VNKTSDEWSLSVPFCIWQQPAEDEGDLVTHAWSHRLKQSFEFNSISAQLGIQHPAQVYPTGPLLAVHVKELSELIRNFHFFTVDHLLAIGNAHNVVFASSSKKIIKATLQRVLASHQCNDRCKCTGYVFKLLLMDCHTARYSSKANGEYSDTEAKTKSRKRKNQQSHQAAADDGTYECVLTADKQQHSKDRKQKGVKDAG
jgi:hypothetical protein